MRARRSQELGQTLLEMVVALAVAVMVIIALATVAIKSVRNAQFSRNQTQSQRYAQEAIEQVRTVRDQQGWAIFESIVSASGCYQVDTVNWGLIDGVDCADGDPIGSTIFRRLITITDDGDPAIATERNVSVVIIWADSSEMQTTRLDTKLTKWQ